MKQGRDGKETHEAREVTHQRLSPYFLAQIELYIGFERGVALLGCPYQRYRTVAQRQPKVEVGVQFRDCQRVHVLPQRPSREQVGARGLELARARSQQRELEAPGFDETVDFVEQGRDALHLIHDHPGAWLLRGELAGEHTGITQVVVMAAFIEQINPMHVRQYLRRPSALANAAHTQHEETSSGQAGNSLKGWSYHAVILPCKMTACIAIQRRTGSGLALTQMRQCKT